MKCILLFTFFCLADLTLSDNAHRLSDLGMPNSDHIGRSSSVEENESPVKVGFASGALLNGVTSIAANLPQVSQDGRHYWPSIFSMTRQIGLAGVNGLVDDVSNYERTRALAVAREAACAQQMQCWMSQNIAGVRSFFGTLTEEQTILRGLDCGKVFAGCQLYH